MLINLYVYIYTLQCYLLFSVSATANVLETSSTVSSTSMSDFKNAVMSKSARTHRFKKADDPNRCRECDNNVYFHGVECEVVCMCVCMYVCACVYVQPPVYEFACSLTG